MIHPTLKKMSYFETNAPDFRAAYLRLLSKVYRTGSYYELCAKNYQTKANGTSDPVAAAVADSLSRAAADMDFIFNKGSHMLPMEERQRIVDDTPSPFTHLQQRKAS